MSQQACQISPKFLTIGNLPAVRKRWRELYTASFHMSFPNLVLDSFPINFMHKAETLWLNLLQFYSSHIWCGNFTVLLIKGP